AQTPVSGTLGYAGSWTVAVPAGTSGSELQQDGQQVTSARTSYTAALAIASGDEQALATAAAALQAARLKAASDCAGANAAAQAPLADSTTTTSGADPAQGGGPCASSMQAVTVEQATVATAQQKVAADRAQLAADRSTLASARQVLDAAQATAPSYGS